MQRTGREERQSKSQWSKDSRTWSKMCKFSSRRPSLTLSCIRSRAHWQVQTDHQQTRKWMGKIRTAITSPSRRCSCLPAWCEAARPRRSTRIGSKNSTNCPATWIRWRRARWPSSWKVRREKCSSRVRTWRRRDHWWAISKISTVRITFAVLLKVLRKVSEVWTELAIQRLPIRMRQIKMNTRRIQGSERTSKRCKDLAAKGSSRREPRLYTERATFKGRAAINSIFLILCRSRGLWSTNRWWTNYQQLRAKTCRRTTLSWETPRYRLALKSSRSKKSSMR